METRSSNRSRGDKVDLEDVLDVRETDGILDIRFYGHAEGGATLQASKDITVGEIYALLDQTLIQLLGDEMHQAHAILDLPKERSSESWKRVLGIDLDTPTLGVPFPLRCRVRSRYHYGREKAARARQEQARSTTYGDLDQTPPPKRTKRVKPAKRAKQEIPAKVATGVSFSKHVRGSRSNESSRWDVQ